MTWTRPIYLHYDDRKYDRLFSIGIKNGSIIKHQHRYSYLKIKLFIWKNKIDTHYN